MPAKCELIESSQQLYEMHAIINACIVQLKKLRHRLNNFPRILDVVNGGAEI